MKKKAQILLAQLEVAFENIGGPPRITLAAARQLDDNESNSIEGAKEEPQDWRSVTKGEIIKYHDCWAFLDAQSVKFYLPAFIASHLSEIASGRVHEMKVPDWLPNEFITLEHKKLTLLSDEQLKIMSKYLDFIAEFLPDGLDSELFRSTRKSWKKRIADLRGEA